MKALLFACSIGLLVVIAVEPASAQDRENHGVAHTGAIPYIGSTDDALAAASNSQTIPMTSFTFTASKDGMKYTDVIVGGSPFSRHPAATKVNVLIVPVIVDIGSTTFDPTVDDPCISGANITPLAAFQQSPILRKVIFDGGGESGHAAEMNGVDVGTTTYPDAFRRAEFWSRVKGTNYHTDFNITTAAPWTISASEVQQLGGGNVLTTGCAPLGVLNTGNFQNYIQNTVIPGIPAITPTTFAFFLMKDVVTTTSGSLNCIISCEIGYHAAFGSPVQTFAVSEYDSTADFWNSPGIKDISVDAHEVSEWLDDPLVTNPTPAWGNIGQVSGCQENWESGDPLTGTDFPAITMPDGVTYDPQELAFWSWYYNAEDAQSTGAGGKFSDNGTFAGPSEPCPPGGTYDKLTVNEVGQGTVTSTDGKINCTNGSGACTAVYPSGSAVTLNAAPAANWGFAGWSGACSGGNPCNLSMNSNLNVTATFTSGGSPPTVTTTTASMITNSSATLNGTVNPNGSDTHFWFEYSTNSSMTGAISTPQQDAGSGTTTLSVSANISGLTSGTTYYFQIWASNSTGTSSGSVVSFVTTGSPPMYMLSPILLGAGNVTSTDNMINCTNTGTGYVGACTAMYASGATVTMNATATSGWRFVQWSSSASPSCNGPNPCVVTFTDTNLSPTATFTYGTISYVPLHSFAGSDGICPVGIVQGSNGTIFGTAASGGSYNNGVLYEISPSGGSFNVLHSFNTTNGTDGDSPLGKLSFGSDGVTLYGTTETGGDNYGLGTAFTFNTSTQVFSTVYAFGGAGNGIEPQSGLTLASNEFLYGTTSSGGSESAGEVYSISPSGTYAPVYAFKGSPSDGATPYAGLALGPDGDLYGTTIAGGSYGCGIIFKVDTSGDETVLYNFSNGADGLPDGCNGAFAGLVLGQDGLFYGVSVDGGTATFGYAYSIGSTSNTFQIIHSFVGEPADIVDPFTPLILANDGYLYGNYTSGGAGSNAGAVLRMDSQGNVTLLYSFPSFVGSSQWQDWAGWVIQGSNGTFYGTTCSGGSGDGTLFELTVSPSEVRSRR